MKKSVTILLLTLIFIFGAAICLYPTVSSYLNGINESKAIENQQNAVEEMSKDSLDKEKNAVIAYNKSLVDNHIVLTDPFDSDAFPITDGKYEELLAFSEAMASIEIPKINVNLPIYHGTDEKTLQKGVGHLENTSLPLGGESTHTVLSAHTGLPSQKLFSDLDKLSTGDIFYIYVLDEKLSYRVNQIKIVEPDDSADLMIINGQDYVTLVTCTPYGKNTHRLLVRGERIENEIAEQKIIAQEAQMNFFDKLLQRYGISFREFIVFASIGILTFAFIIVIIFLSITGKRRGKHEKSNS